MKSARMQKNKEEKPEEENAELRQVVVEQAKQLLQKEKELAKKDEELAKKDEELAKKDEELAKKDEELTKLEKRVAELESLKNVPGKKPQKLIPPLLGVSCRFKPINKWCANSKSSILEISGDGLSVFLESDYPANLSELPLWEMTMALSHLKGTVRAKFPLQRGQPSVVIAYFEVKVVKEMTVPTYVGLSPREFPLDEAIGTFAESYSYDSCDGFLNINGKEKKSVPALGGNEGTVGCGIGSNGQLFFTLNGTLLGDKLSLPKVNPCVELYPAVTLGGHGTKVEANFGDNPAKPFMFNVESVKCLDQPD